MSELVDWMKDIYIRSKENNFIWKPVYPNNMPCNHKTGVYTDMNLKRDGKYKYLKYTISYESRCDEGGLSHPEEGTRYYVLHELRINDLEEKVIIPEPTDKFEHFKKNDSSTVVNNYGRFRYVFDDKETAKKVVCSELIHMIYPYTYILNDDECKEWNEFLEELNDG